MSQIRQQIYDAIVSANYEAYENNSSDTILDFCDYDVATTRVYELMQRVAIEFLEFRGSNFIQSDHNIYVRIHDFTGKTWYPNDIWNEFCKERASKKQP